MPSFRDYYPRSVGIPWVRKEDYAAFLAISEDAYGFPATWEEFNKFSEEAERAYKADGLIVERAYIDPETFPDWCSKNGVRVNSQGRNKFAATVAAKHAKDQ